MKKLLSILIVCSAAAISCNDRTETVDDTTVKPEQVCIDCSTVQNPDLCEWAKALVDSSRAAVIAFPVTMYAQVVYTQDNGKRVNSLATLGGTISLEVKADAPLQVGLSDVDYVKVGKDTIDVKRIVNINAGSLTAADGTIR